MKAIGHDGCGQPAVNGRFRYYRGRHVWDVVAIEDWIERSVAAQPQLEAAV